MLSSYPHLMIRNHTYYARFVVPKHLMEIAKRRNFFYSLYTKDYYDALHKVKEYAYKTDLLMQSYERKYNEMLKLRHKHTKEIRKQKQPNQYQKRFLHLLRTSILSRITALFQVHFEDKACEGCALNTEDFGDL